MSGVPFWGTDIGGFFPVREYTGELHVRWFQFGAFCPLFRAHGRAWQLRLPWGWNTGKFGPLEMPESAMPDPSELHNPNVEPIVRKYLELRYRMMPYIYSIAREAHETGLPMMRALWLHYAADPRAVERGDEFLWGRDILVAPVVEKGATSRRLYLPPGAWYDFWTGVRTEGGREVERPVDLETMPLYVRAGAIIPTGPLEQYTSEKPNDPITLAVYPGADGRFTLYEDDGVTFNFQKGEFMKLRCEWNDRERRLSLRLEPGSRMMPPAKRTIRARLGANGPVKEVLFTGQPSRLRLEAPQ